MEEDTEYKKLPLEERCVHKLWKARVDGYEEAGKIFRTIDDEKSPEWNKFLSLIKKFVADSNAVAQEKGLEAALIYIENAGNAGKTVGETMSAIVQKCIAAPKTRTKELAVQVALMYMEIEKQDAVVDELIKGMDHKNPKTVAACTSAVTLGLHEFGSKVINVKPLIKKLAPLMSDRDKTVREEGKQLAIEIFRWIGLAMKPQIASLPQVTITELENEFDKLKGEKAEPLRYLKSQQEKQKAISSAVGDAGDAGNAEEIDDGVGCEVIDPLDLLDPVDILSKLPKDFYDKLEAKKWQDRKESLEILEKLLENPKLESGDYGDLVRALKKVLTKDSNVILVAMSGKCMAALAKGLGKKFSIYAGACVPAILEKFKEKKSNVVTALRDAIDAIYPVTSFESIQDDVIEALNNKNPSVKSETASFLARAFTRTQPTSLNKKVLKQIVTALLKTLSEPDPTVRDCAADALGTLTKLVGEKAIAAYMGDVDALKMAKIKEFQDKAVIVIKITGAKKERPATAPPPTAKSAPSKAGSSEARPVSRPATGIKKATVRKSTASSAAPLAKSGSTSKMLPTERELTPEEIETRAEETLTPDILAGLGDANWKTRLAAVENFTTQIADLDGKSPGLAQVLIRTLCQRKPGLKETNFQVLKIKLDIIRIIAEKFQPFTATTGDLILNEVTEKLADAKNGTAAAQALTAIAEATKLEYTVSKVMSFAFEQKSPKVQSEALIWTSMAIKEFGFQINPKILIDDVKKGVQSTNPTVRQAAVVLCGTMAMYMGNTIMMFMDSEKPALKTQIETEISKNNGQKPPQPIRGVNKSSSPGFVNEDEEYGNDDGGGGSQETINMADLLPRVDISSHINEALLAEISDKNWKTRNEGLIKLQNILNEAKLIKPSIGDLPQALAPRLSDSNAKIAQTALAICEQLATAIGPACKTHLRTLFPMFLHGLGDNKIFIRQTSLSCINTWGEQCGYKEFFDNEMLADAVKNGPPALKIEVWAWIAEKLPNIPVKSIPKDEIASLLPILYANICDRNVDVRKNANEAVLGIMIHIGYEAMVKALDKQKPASKKDIQAALDKARPNLPVKPLPKGKQQAPIEETARPSKIVAGKSSNAKAQAKGNEKTAASRKKEEEVDTSPLLAVNSTKNQRLIDEQKMRVLKWTFTTPREEFTELLREQITTANVNKGLIANMFHDDFRYHLKVIESLVEDLPNNSKALISNLDLILKWLSLRFYDTNPSVLLKGLEYLNMVFQMLIDHEYILAENEGSAFIPHLLTKIGDPKDAVRNGVRSLMRQICCVYPFVKVFAYLMDGLKSKNARQRTECLDELGYLIETYSMSVCQPSPQTALKEIARHISDRDNSVRNAALNCVVQAYFLTGDKVYKLIGNLNEKDLSMLDERIKRAKKTKKPTPPPILENTIKQSPGQPQEQIEIEDTIIIGQHEDLSQSDDNISPAVSSTSKLLEDSNGLGREPIPTLKRQATFDQPKPQIANKISGPFCLEPDVVDEIERDWVKSNEMPQRELETVDLAFMYEPIKIHKINGVGYPEEKFEQLISLTHPLPLTNNGVYNLHTMSPPQTGFNTNTYSARTAYNAPTENLANALPAKLDPVLMRIVKSIASADSLTARAAMTELSDIIESPDKQAVLRDYEEMFIQSVSAQFKIISQSPISESRIMYQPLLSIIFAFFTSKSLGKTLSVSSLKNIMSVLLGLLADQKLAAGDDGQYTKVINGICVKILDKTNFTNLNCALIRLLKETCPSAGLPKFTDLLMKCIWRNVKMMPDRSNEIDYDAVLCEIHEFMLALPSVWWHQRPNDTPLRTIKTITHNMAKLKGNDILQHISNIPPQSELRAYLIRILKNLHKDGVAPSVSPQRSTVTKDLDIKRFSPQTHETMTQIFKLISNTETSQQGLTKLYDFKEKNPEVDIVPFLKGASPCFQKYIEDGLAELEKQNTVSTTNGDTNKLETKIIAAPTHQPGNLVDPDYWLKKLHVLRGKSSPGKATETNLIDNKVTDENLNLNQIQPKVSLIRTAVTQKSELSPNRMEHIQQKLAQYKQQQQS